MRMSVTLTLRHPFSTTMRRAIVLMLLLPATAAAAPARAPDTEPALNGAPYLFRNADGLVRLVLRTDAPLQERFDGLIGGGAIIAGHAAPIGTVADCYTAAVRFHSHIGRHYRVLIATLPGEPAEFDLRLTPHRARPGDTRGRPLGC
jgi:hypothetical protein